LGHGDIPVESAGMAIGNILIHRKGGRGRNVKGTGVTGWIIDEGCPGSVGRYGVCVLCLNLVRQDNA
jgi:hypothetical protein